MRKFIVLALALLLIAGASVDITLANQHNQDNNVSAMTSGNAQIVQHEYERYVNENGAYVKITTPRGTGYKIQPFTQDKPLYPAVGKTGSTSDIVYFDQIDLEHATGGQYLYGNLKNIQDKFVLVQNTGDVDVYVRTIFAFELGDVTEKNWVDIIQDGRNKSNWKWYNMTPSAKATIDGNNYFIAVAVYKGASNGSRHKNGVLPPEDYTYNNLGQIYMTSNATNEDCKIIDGNNNGVYDVLVLSQAVQTSGWVATTGKTVAETALDKAFGTVTPENVQVWFEDVAALVPGK